MNLSAQFKSYLLSKKHPASKATVKNYLSDVNRFIAWFEAKFGRTFDPNDISPELIVSFKSESLASYSASSVERSLSSLRKFFTFLSLERLVSQNPFEFSVNEEDIDPWKIKDYKNYLFLLNASPLTIKNYIIDLKQFINWLESTAAPTDRTIRELSYLIYNIDSRLISDYKTRLLENLRLNPTSVNRKLSSLRSYMGWAQEQGIIKNDSEIYIENENKASIPLILPVPTSTPKKSYEKSFETYSSFPPARLIQKSKKGASLLFDAILIAPLAFMLTQLDEFVWVAKGKPVFEDKSIKSPLSNILEPLQPPSGPVRNIPKSYYAPTHISVANFPLHKKVWHNLRYSRPEWYRRYHTYAFVSYLHFSILMLVVLTFGYVIFLNSENKQESTAVLGAITTGPDRTLTFQGRLTDAEGSAIETGTNLRMSIYRSKQSSGSALLWQELVFATPNDNGIFNIVLGENSPIPQSLFYQNPALWLGVAVENTTELSPRQPIATVAYAQNADTIHGLPPITNSRSNSNVLLALNSSGNLTIGGRASPVFQVTGGTFTLSGKILALTTTNGSNGDIRISPNGTGIVDIQKIIKNTTEGDELIPGAVQVDDLFVINGSSLDSALLNISQASTGDLIVASVSGTTKFLVDNAGNITAGGSFNGLSVSSGTITIGTWNGAVIKSEYGGTGINTSGSTGVPFISSGTWSVDSNYLAVNHGGTGISSYSTGDIIYADGSESLARLGIGANGNCLISNGSIPVWGSCASPVNTTTNWSSGLGAVFPLNSTQDVLIGGQSSNSAKFAILNVSSPRGSQVASISGSITLDSSSATIETTNNQPLTIGGGNTGNININNILGGTFTTFDTVSSTVGIGISLPEAELHVTRPLSFGATGKALVILDQVENQDILTASSAGSTVFRVANDGTVELNLATAGTTNDAICWDNSGSSLLYDCDSTPADYAESYPVYSDVVYGEIVMVTDEIVKTKIGTNVPRLTKATNSQSGKILGVTSDNWHDFTSAGKDEININDNPMPVALNGRVLTKVTTENGNIKVGDPITASSIPGAGMKSTKPERVVGTALEAYSSQDPNETGEILVFINPTWYDPVIMFASNTNGLTLNETNDAFEITHNGSAIERFGAYSDIFVANLKAGYLELGRLTVNTSQIAIARIGELSTNSLAVATENVTIAGTSLRNYIYSIVDERIGSNQIALASPILETDIIRPGNSNSLVLELPTDDSTSSFEIKNASGSAVARIDATGDASFSGRLSSNEIQTSDASVSGTLRADRIVADQIDLSDNALSVLQNSIASTPAITNNYYYNSFTNAPAPISSSGTGSATLATITAGIGTFTNGLISFGDTSFYDATIANRLFVGAQLSIADQSINVLGANLKIQPLAQGGVDFLSGKIVIDTDGNLNVNGNAYFAKNVDINGKLAAGIISPLPGKGLVFQFDEENNAIPNVEFRTGTGSAVLSFNNKGDINSSGSGTFNKLNLNIIPEAIAISDTEVIATGSAGTTEIKPYKNELTIKNPLVTKDSLIYITPKTSVSNQSIYLLRQVDGESFTVGLSKVVDKSVPFNWILIN